MSENPPSRRWFRFSLRTVFILMTLAGVGMAWLVYQLNWIRQRHEMLKTYPEYVTAKTFRGALVRPSSKPPARAPFPLWLFGEPGWSYFVFVRPESDEAVNRVRELFPEATIQVQK